MQNEIDAAIDELLKHRPELRVTVSRVHSNGERYWIATAESTWLIGSGATPMTAVWDYVQRDNGTVTERMEKLRNELATLEGRQ